MFSVLQAGCVTVVCGSLQAGIVGGRAFGSQSRSQALNPKPQTLNSVADSPKWLLGRIRGSRVGVREGLGDTFLGFE